MTKDKSIQTEVGGYVSNLLRTHFGKGPTSVYVSFNRPFLTVYFRGFIVPMEKILIKQNEAHRVLETRDLLFNEMKEEVRQELWASSQLDVKEFYADWHLENETGMIIAILNENMTEEIGEWPAGLDKTAFIDELIKASEQAEKKPESTEAYWLNDRTLLVRRTQILVAIEKELIRNGFGETLKLAKRPLEHKVLNKVPIEKALNRKVVETFVDWNFEADEAYLVFILEPLKKTE
jgi:uncharacterized protein YbcI